MIQIYKNLKEEDVFIPYKSSMRLWKFKLQNNKFISLHIPNKNKLIKYLEKYQPKDVWFTNGLFLNSKNLENQTYKIRLIKKNLIFDLDDIKRNEIKRLIKALKPFKLTLDYIINTSKNSYQVSFKDDYKKEIINHVIKDKVGIDQKIYDERRVIRCPLTYHHSGHFINFINFINSPLSIDDRQESQKAMTKDINPLEKIGSKENLPNPSSKLFIPTYINKINGKAILYLKFKNKKIEWIKKFLYDFDIIYRIGFGIIRTKRDCIDFICPRAFDIKRLKKIYKDKKSGIRYININDKVLDKELFITGNFYRYPYSRPHLKYINKFEFPINYYLKQIGEENPVLILGK